MATEKRLIDANVLLKALGYDPMKFWAITPESTFGIVLNTPTVDAVEVVHGRWIWNEENECCVCSNCELSALNNYRGNSTESNYCPNCGAKMDGDGND